MIKFNIEAPGLKELAKRLKDLPDELNGKFVRATMGEAVKPTVRRAQENAPVDSGRLQLQIGKQSAIKGDQVFVRVGVLLTTKKGIERSLKKKEGGKSKGTVLTHDAYYDFMVELGTEKMAARPFLMPAFDATKEEFVATFVSKTNTKLDKFYRSLPNTK